MIELHLKDDIAKLQKQYAHLGNVVTKAANASLNKAAKSVQTLAAREISKATNIKPQKKVKQALQIQRSSFKTLAAYIRPRRLPINMVEFVAPSKRQYGAFKKLGGVTTSAWGKKITRKGAFIAAGKGSGKPLVFIRIGRSKLKAIPGPSIPMSLLRREIQGAVIKKGSEQFRKNFRHELNRAISRIK